MSQLTPEELASVKDLQSKYNQTVFEIGVAETQILTFEKQIAKLRDDKAGLINDLETLQLLSKVRGLWWFLDIYY